METPEDRTPSADSLAPDRMGLTHQSSRIPLLFVGALLLSAVIVYGLPLGFGNALASFVLVAFFVIFLAVQRSSLETQTLRALVWGLGGAACEFVGWTIWRVVDQSLAQGVDSIVETPSFGTSWLPYFSIPSMGFIIGAFAGLRWPDRLLLPGLHFRTFNNRRVLMNLLEIALIAILWSYLFRQGLTHLVSNRASWFVLGIIIFSVVFYPALLILVAMSSAATSQARRVLLWGAVGLLISLVLTIVLGYGLYWVAIDEIIQESERLELGIQSITIKLSYSISLLPFVGFWLGVWAGLRWPDRLAFPRGLSWIPPGSGAMRNLTALTFYSICAGLVFWVAALLTILITEPDAFL